MAPSRPDLSECASDVRAGRVHASELLDAALARADEATARHVFVRRFDADARATARAVDATRDAGGTVPLLAGLAVSVKDLFDVAGQPTTAASPALRDAVPARADAVAVARLRAAGAAIVGHTNLSEFAFSGVGLNRAFGTPANPATVALDAAPRIPGGSTSGGAVSVAGGAAWAALGSDTGGSIRIPAALQGLVGFKGTAALVPTDGAIALAPSFDTACAITHSVRDAALLHGVLADGPVELASRPTHALRLAVPRSVMLDTLDERVARAFERALDTLRAAGATVETMELSLLAQLRDAQLQGRITAAEAWALHHERLAQRADDYDPRVVLRIRRGASIDNAELARLQQQRHEAIAAFTGDTAGYDALLSPTVPIVAPTIAELLDDDERFFAVNTLLLRNTSLVNLLDGCAISLPCHGPGDWPVGAMLWAPAGADARLLGTAQAVEHALRRVRAA